MFPYARSFYILYTFIHTYTSLWMLLCQVLNAGKTKVWIDTLFPDFSRFDDLDVKFHALASWMFAFYCSWRRWLKWPAFLLRRLGKKGSDWAVTWMFQTFCLNMSPGVNWVNWVSWVNRVNRGQPASSAGVSYFDVASAMEQWRCRVFRAHGAWIVPGLGQTTPFVGPLCGGYPPFQTMGSQRRSR